MNLKAEVGIRHSQGRSTSDSQRSTKSPVRGMEQAVLHSPRRERPSGTLMPDCQPPELQNSESCGPPVRGTLLWSLQ